jgi:hypothetical protein
VQHTYQRRAAGKKKKQIANLKERDSFFERHRSRCAGNIRIDIKEMDGYILGLPVSGWKSN